MGKFSPEQLYLVAPELSLILLALVVMTVDLFVKRRNVVAATALIGLLVPAGFTIALILQGVQSSAFSGMLVVDPYALFFDVVFLLIAAVMILTSYNYVGRYVRADGEFYTLLLFSTVGMMFMASTRELITIYIALELTSIPLYVMAGLIRKSEKSAEAAVKYVLLGAMSSAILLYGFALLYGLTGTTDLPGIATAVKAGVHDGNLMVLVACVLVVAGFGFKISAVPFHMWAPDIYEGAPTPATSFFSVGSKAAGFAALIRVFMAGGLWQIGSANLTSVVIVLSIIAALTMTLGNLVAAVQSNIKRMMAYSSIAQAGYILVGFIGSFALAPQGVQASSSGNATVLFFILVYVVTNLGAFAGIIALAHLTGGEKISDFRGLWQRAPLLSLCTAFCLLSLAGIPPFAGFLSKVFLFSAAWNLHQEWLVVLALLNSIVSLVYYGRVVKTMFFDEPAKPDHLKTPLGLGVALVFTSAGLVVLTFIAQLILEAAQFAAGKLM
jgi:NADH-quinone oxidoreductase subunit N